MSSGDGFEQVTSASNVVFIKIISNVIIKTLFKIKYNISYCEAQAKGKVKVG